MDKKGHLTDADVTALRQDLMKDPKEYEKLMSAIAKFHPDSLYGTSGANLMAGDKVIATCTDAFLIQGEEGEAPITGAELAATLALALQTSMLVSCTPVPGMKAGYDLCEESAKILLVARNRIHIVPPAESVDTFLASLGDKKED